jgi:hypothetical protein
MRIHIHLEMMMMLVALLWLLYFLFVLGHILIGVVLWLHVSPGQVAGALCCKGCTGASV